MTVTTTPQDLAKWLKATTLTAEAQESFIKRFEDEGKWTPQLAEDFAEIIMTSMKAYEEDLESFRTEMDKRTSEIRKINKKMKMRYKESKKLQSEAKNSEEVGKIMEQMA